MWERPEVGRWLLISANGDCEIVDFRIAAVVLIDDLQRSNLRQTQSCLLTCTFEIFLLFQHTVVWGIFSLLCSFVCTVPDFSAAEKDRGVKFCTRIRLLSEQVFSHFGKLWLTWSHGGGITSRIYASTHWSHAAAPGEARWAVEIGGGSVD